MRHLLTLASILTLSVSMNMPAITAVAAEPTIKIEQSGETDATGDWALIYPDNRRKTGSDSFTLSTPIAGRYLFIIEQPDGMGTKITLRRNGEQEKPVHSPQIVFTYNEGDEVILDVYFSLSVTGEASVQSDPSGIPFVLQGPNDTEYEGVTPFSIDETPIGQYSVRYTPPAGCGKPVSFSDQLVKEGRVSFDLKLNCEAATDIRNDIRASLLDARVTVESSDGDETVLDDVPEDAWFAPAVRAIVKRGILSGYSDARGKLTGKFGPENAVTVAELSKIAHKLGSVDEGAITARTENRSAIGQWFAQFFASAEQRGWVIFSDATINPSRPATRAEVVITFLQALDIPVSWPHGDVFGDVHPRTPHAAAIETAAAHGLVEGNGGNFNPSAPINRAEIAQMLVRAIEIYKVPSAQ